jgi:2-phospho-L-lactate guanylyltransferase
MTAAVVIAVRGGPTAKSRCAAALTSGERRALVAAMLEDMLAAAMATHGVHAVTVITPTPALATLAKRRGARVLFELQAGGLNAAFDAAVETTGTAGRTLLLLPGDLPLVRSGDLEPAIAAARQGAVVLAPSRADGGTGAIALPPGVRIPFQFGPDSFRRHGASTRAMGRAPHIIASGPLGYDIDRPEDLERVLLAPATHSAAVLRRIRAAVPLKDIA